MKITVAIPTIAGRSKYLASAIATCTADPDPDLEILVSDNSAGDNEALVRGLPDPRVRYVRPAAFLPMAAHWEFLLGHVSGEAVCIIGDDDGLMPGALAALRGLYQKVGNVPIHHALANYCWPDHPDQAMRNRIQFIHPPIAADGWRSSLDFLADIAALKAVYLEGPMIYHNFLPMPLVRSIAGYDVFFRRPIPDVYSVLAVAANTERFYVTRHVLTLAGQGARSNGALVSTGTSDGSTFAATADPNYLPRFHSRSVAMLTLDSLLEVANRWPSAMADIHIDVAQFLSAALSETRQMPSREARRREVSAALKAAWDSGEIARLVGQIGRRAVSKLGRVSGFTAPGGVATRPPDLVFNGDVNDVLGATRRLGVHLDHFAKPIDAR